MSKLEIDVYRELQQHLDTFPVGYPSTESGVEIRLLKQLFTLDEAKIALHLKFSHKYENFESLNSIFERLDQQGFEYTKDELETHLENLAKKGAIRSLKQGDQKISDIAKKIQKKLGGDLDEIVRTIPPNSTLGS